MSEGDDSGIGAVAKLSQLRLMWGARTPEGTKPPDIFFVQVMDDANLHVWKKQSQGKGEDTLYRRIE